MRIIRILTRSLCLAPNHPTLSCVNSTSNGLTKAFRCSRPIDVTLLQLSTVRSVPADVVECIAQPTISKNAHQSNLVIYTCRVARACCVDLNILENKMSGKKVYSKPELEKLIEAQDGAISYSVPKHATSPLWTKFTQIYVSSEAQPIAQCNHCRNLVHWKASYGTNGMAKHTCQLPRSSQPSSTAITTYFKQSAPTGLISSMKRKIATAAAEMCALDSRSFCSIEGEGFRLLSRKIFGEFLIQIREVHLRAVVEERFCSKTKTRLNHILEAGSLLGKSCEISQLLPHRNTISSIVDDLYSVHRKQLVEICASIQSFAITIDFWTESYTGVGYGGITLHCVHPREGLTTFVLCCQLYDMPSSSAVNIRLWTEQCLRGFGLQLENQYVVSDNENKMCAAFERNVTRIRCSTHMLNKIIEHGLSDKSGMLFLWKTFS